MVIVATCQTMGATVSSKREQEQNLHHSVGILDDDEKLGEKIYVDVSVTNPIIYKDSMGSFFTSYAIYLETNDSAFTMTKSMVRRRFSEFVALRSILKEQHPSSTVPKLPGKTILGKRFDQPFIDERCKALEAFLQNLFLDAVYLSNKSLHMFLQTTVSMSDVRRVMNEGTSFELPVENRPLILRAVENRRSSGRVGILKQENIGSLSSCPDRVCNVKTKHEHMRVGSGIVVCAGQPNLRAAVASSAPFNIPGSNGSPKFLRSCAGDTCLDGATGSSVGSKKKVSFFLEKENRKLQAKSDSPLSPLITEPGVN